MSHFRGTNQMISKIITDLTAPAKVCSNYQWQIATGTCKCGRPWNEHKESGRVKVSGPIFAAMCLDEQQARDEETDRLNREALANLTPEQKETLRIDGKRLDGMGC